MMIRPCLSVALAVCVAGVTGHAAVGSATEPVAWDAGIKLAQPEDLNPDPGIVEINLTAKAATVEVAPGRRVNAWTYNGGLPGPLIRTRVGDRLIVHFKNELTEPTTVHWHGVRVPIEMDGVPGISQPDVAAGRNPSTTTLRCATRASTGITRT